MGISLGELIKGEEIKLDDLQGKPIAFDAYNMSYQFLSIIRDRFTGQPLRDSKGNITSHLSGLLYRTTKFIEAGITPIFVWDGNPPDLKRKTIEGRVKIRALAAEKWKQAVKEGEQEKIRTYAQAAIRLTKDMVEESKKLLNYMGVQSIQAESEGEAQCAFMCKNNQVWCTASQDFDALAFGSPKLVRNLSITGKRKIPRKGNYIFVNPELISIDAVLKNLGLNQDQLIILGILIGTDYNPGGIKGIGPKTALKLVKEHKTLDKILKQINWEYDADPYQIFDFFKNPPVRQVEIKSPEFQPDKIMKIMSQEHDFSSERIQKVVERLTNAQKNKKQTGLGKFFS